MRNQENITHSAVNQLEQSIKHILEFSNASMMLDAILFLLCGGKESEMHEDERKAIYQAIKLFHDLVGVQNAERRDMGK